MAALKKAFQELQQSSKQSGQHDYPYVGNYRLDEGTFSFAVHITPSSKAVPVSVPILSEDDYPRSSVCVCLEDDSNQGVQEALVRMQEEHFASSATLRQIVDKVLEVFKQQAASQSQDVAMGQASSGSVSEMDVDQTSPRQTGRQSMDRSEAAGDEGGSFGGGSDEEDAGSDGGYGQDEDDEEEEEDDEDERAMLIECGKRQGRWERHENARAEAEAEQVKSMSAQHLAAQKQQIFDSKEAFLMLSKELLDIFKRQSYTMFVDTVGDDVYHWAVELSSFAPGSALAADMAEVQRKYGYTSVKLTLTFMRHLHPFYPASVAMVRPHFMHWAHGAIASHPMLQPSNWDPLRPQLQFIEQIKTFLENNVRVDLSSELNDLQRFPTASYRPVEQHLAQLEALSGMQPVCVLDAEHGSSQAKQLYEQRGGANGGRDQGSDGGGGGRKRGRSSADEGATSAQGGDMKATPGAKTKTDKAEEKTYWARGTGYGSGHQKPGEVWDQTASIAMQQARDMELMRVILALANAVAHEMGPLPSRQELAALTTTSTAPSVSTSAAAAASGNGSTSTRTTRSRSKQAAPEPAPAVPAPQPQQPNPEADEFMKTVDDLQAQLGPEPESATTAGPSTSLTAADLSEYPPDSAACRAALQASCLVPLLVRELRTASFSDMCARQPYYAALMKLLMQLCRPELQQLLCSPLPAHVEGGVSLAQCVSPLHTSARQYIQLTKSALQSKMTEEKSLQEQVDKSATAIAQAQLKSCTEALTDLRAATRLAILAVQAASACSAVALSHQAQQQTGTAGTSKAGSSRGAAGTSVDADVEYRSAMKPLQVALLDLTNHKYASNATSEGVQPSERVIRLGREIAGLSSDLALSTSSSVFVRVDESNMQLWRAIITGPDDTPYSGGCFTFDFYFPSSYPQVCPLVNLKTTGGGSVRFNPNLYNCGKVCLSLLGTWSGGKGEGWLPNVSTANQVLLSIQSLIFVEHPYFNEPGYERSIGTPEGDAATRRYNEVIREATIRYAMLDQLKNPLKEFEDVITTHFRLRKAAILKVVDGWVADKGNGSVHTSTLKSLRDSLNKALEKL